MDAAKVKELISELRSEIEPKLEAIRVLEKLLAGGVAPQQETFTVAALDKFYGSNESYVNLAIRIINEQGGAPMAVKDIVARIRGIKGNPGIERRSVESTLYQNTKSEHPRLVKAGRGMYALIKRFPREESAA